MKKKFLLFCMASMAFAQTALIEKILSDIEIRNDLSQQTKRENGGISYIYTRRDLEALQVRYLRDVLQLTPLTYKFNRYGIIDPFNPNSLVPFLSSYIKVYIDNQEVDGGLYGSALAGLGDIDLGFVDHIEIYTQAPSLEVTTEPSIAIIKLYTKKAERDEGVDLLMQRESYASSLLSFTYGKVFPSFSTLLFGSYNKKNVKPIGKPDRNAKRWHTLVSLYDEKQKFLLYAGRLQRGGFIGFSLDGNLDDEGIDTKMFHIHYDRVFSPFQLHIAVDDIRNSTHYSEWPVLTYINRQRVYEISTKSHSLSATYDLSYKHETKNNIFFCGLKYKDKHFKYKKLTVNNKNLTGFGHTRQKATTLYLQESYFLAQNSIINAGIAYSFVHNNANIDDYRLKLYRVGHTYVKGKSVFKTNYAHIEYHIDPYLMNSFFLYGSDLPSVKIDNIFEDFKYTLDSTKEFEAIVGYFKGKNYFFPNRENKLYTIRKKLDNIYYSLRFNWRYRPFDKLSLVYYGEEMRNVPMIGSYKFSQFVATNYHRLKNLEFFEELLAQKHHYRQKKYNYTVNVGVRYSIDEDKDFFIRADNIGGKRYDYSFFRFDPIRLQPLSPLKVPFNEKRVRVGMEWVF